MAGRPGAQCRCRGPTSMQALCFVLSPSGRLRPLPFFIAAIVFIWRASARTCLTMLAHSCRLAALAVCRGPGFVLWIWFALHAQRLHDVRPGSDLALGRGLIYACRSYFVDRRECFLQIRSGLLGRRESTNAIG